MQQCHFSSDSGYESVQFHPEAIPVVRVVTGSVLGDLLASDKLDPVLVESLHSLLAARFDDAGEQLEVVPGNGVLGGCVSAACRVA